MRSTTLLRTALGALSLFLAACTGISQREATPGPPVPSIDVSGPPATISGNVVALPVTVHGISIVKADGDTSGKTGHFHVFIDREPIPAGQPIPKEKGIVHSAENPIKLYGLTVGKHTATVTLGDGTHTRILGSVSEQVTLTVAGPAVQATAPATVRAGEPVSVEVKVEGLQLVAADGDSSGKTGHLHLLIDKELPVAAQPIPKGDPMIIHTTQTSVPLPALAAGEHTIWVVAGDGLHQPLQPLVAAKVVVTVQE